MRVSILGAAGFLGRKLAARLAAEARLGGRTIEALTLFDVEPPRLEAAGVPVRAIGGDLAELPAEAVPEGTDVVFHLAAVVSAAAEADYALGRRVNVRGTEAVIDACRRLARPPRVVFTSTIASFSVQPGAQAGEELGDATRLPANSYGTQKAASELFLMDATRRGFLDAVSLRLPTIVVRPGRPNRAASSFVSAIVREPLLGLRTTLPVAEDLRLWIASPARAVEWLIHAATLDTAGLGLDRGINPPGATVTVAELLAALDAVSPGASALVDREPDAAIARIVESWPAAFETTRARALGFTPQEPLATLVRAFVAEDLEPTRRERAGGGPSSASG
jgi:nucleoside-diphosphate-sugar epimerase